jgi:hypothetical protein
MVIAAVRTANSPKIEYSLAASESRGPTALPEEAYRISLFRA